MAGTAPKNQVFSALFLRTKFNVDPGGLESCYDTDMMGGTLSSGVRGD